MAQYISSKPVVALLLNVCHAYGVKHVILSPGSRNAPLIISFSGCGLFKCLSIPDERSAAYFALGLAQTSRKPVAIVCTSGTAALNYAPAVAEAYYQKAPLIVITSDRPARMIDQADGQAIRQNGIYQNFIRFQCTLPETDGNDDLRYANRLLNEAFIAATGNVQGPVHINIPFREPLYGKTTYTREVYHKITAIAHNLQPSAKAINVLTAEIETCHRIMILVGADTSNAQLAAALSLMAQKGAVVVTETLSNIRDARFFENTDRIVSAIEESEYTLFSPDLLITFDTPVLSRMIKKLIRSVKPQKHWHFTNNTTVVDTYDSLTRMVAGSPEDALRIVAEKMTDDSRFYETWKERACITARFHNDFTANLSWCDLKLFKILNATTIPYPVIHLGNSTPVRYAQLFGWSGERTWFANRGTSGIDGCVSTAAGAAFGTAQPVLLITGDLSFLYDSNGLWHHHLPASFRVIVINNGGGGIFRYVQGPMETDELEDFFETRQTAHCKPIAEAFGFACSACYDEASFAEALKTFFAQSSKPKLLEVFTPNIENGVVLKNYFTNLAGIV
ncbi:MAG: 2-succinyl-5-enolpyruvyl-6-hydroxy-3-cyclohexene-1-carboxylic-acid synthase [Cytophagaceae bacterium]|nr:2-succinyl-5-enolpyruvyl-6-hydroxy-3-cyclohexene-1-carboxylic-acid synthase [Cytophagaceae bacterium]